MPRRPLRRAPGRKAGDGDRALRSRGNTDVAARIFTERLAARLGKPFLVENRSGAGGTIGITAMTRAPADGYTLATITAGNLYILPHIYRDKLGYDTFKDLKPLAMVATQPNFFVVHPSIPPAARRNSSTT